MFFCLQVEGDPGASTLFREHAWVGGFIKDIGWDNLPKGAILGQLVDMMGVEYRGDTFSFSLINRYGSNYLVKHTGIFDHYLSEQDIVYVHQASSASKFNCTLKTDFSVAKMKKLGWNIWMMPLALFDPDYLVRDEFE